MTGDRPKGGGVLEVHLPKAKEAKGRRIEIKAA
jgi:hypothetical protein